MSKNRIFNGLMAFFMVIGLYHLPGCTVLVDVSTGGQTQTGTTGQTTSPDLTGSASDNEATSTGVESSGEISTASSSGEIESSSSEDLSSGGPEPKPIICGDCIKDDSEECESCLYKQFMSTCQNVITAKCQLTFFPAPQLDCTNNWVGDIGCDSEEADLYCQILTKDPNAKAKDFSVGSYIATRGLFSQQLIGKDGVELISVPDEVYSQVFYYEQNPYLVPTMTLQLVDGDCFTE